MLRVVPAGMGSLRQAQGRHFAPFRMTELFGGCRRDQGDEAARESPGVRVDVIPKRAKQEAKILNRRASRGIAESAENGESFDAETKSCGIVSRAKEQILNRKAREEAGERLALGVGLQSAF